MGERDFFESLLADLISEDGGDDASCEDNSNDAGCENGSDVGCEDDDNGATCADSSRSGRRISNRRLSRKSSRDDADADAGDGAGGHSDARERDDEAVYDVDWVGYGFMGKVRASLEEDSLPIWEAEPGRFVAYGLRFGMGYARAELTADAATETLKLDIDTAYCVPEDKRKDVRRFLVKANSNLIVEGMNLTPEGVVHFTTTDLPLEGNEPAGVFRKGFSTLRDRMASVIEIVQGADAWSVTKRQRDEEKAFKALHSLIRS